MARLNTEQRQDMIIDEAIKIIHTSGYQSLSIRELAKQVKISEPAIYRHFLNKEDIILGILNRMMDFDHLLEKDILKQKTTQEKIRHFISFHFDFLEKKKEMTSVLFAEDMFDQSEILRQRLMFIIQKRKNLLNTILDTSKTNGEMIEIDNKDVVSIILGLIRMIVLEWRLSNFTFSLSERGKGIIKTLDKLIFVQ
ncbi:MAG: TetR/AcrR family transcriptional regulator [Ignavibacteriaceae bacterium]|nr:TetR/AcrR family transcriptional regulator [Ignavibacterium sp.]MCC6253470.1 TetR/AcrR family transcriptional regulator [Ignavibacteriaceae bacterium]HRQ54816.1 TetR/AcrR family transcriptional regulator [Ignavibacteriaceae bacterium]